VSDGGHVWWEDAVVYEVYPRSFADADGDGVGDLPGLRSRLGYLADLGVDAVWLTPFYPSPLADGGYDVSDYRAVDPLLGTMADFDALVSGAAAHQIRVIIDLVPNHCSSARQRRAGQVHLPRRPRPRRRPTAEQLAVAVRRPRVDPGDRGRRPASRG
jgi:1,4-alpha-glucan branching enzyme